MTCLIGKCENKNDKRRVKKRSSQKGKQVCHRLHSGGKHLYEYQF
jgi:hypothetical protein